MSAFSFSARKFTGASWAILLFPLGSCRDFFQLFRTHTVFAIWIYSRSAKALCLEHNIFDLLFDSILGCFSRHDGGCKPRRQAALPPHTTYHHHFRFLRVSCHTTHSPPPVRSCDLTDRPRSHAADLRRVSASARPLVIVTASHNITAARRQREVFSLHPAGHVRLLKLFPPASSLTMLNSLSVRVLQACAACLPQRDWRFAGQPAFALRSDSMSYGSKSCRQYSL